MDERLKNLPYFPKLPHLANMKFMKGLSSIATKKTKKAQGNATGAGDGYRSSWWVDALLWLYFCIGHNGDVLPNVPNYSINLNKKGAIPRQNQLGNPTAKVFNAIYCMLDVYFQCKRSAFSDNCITKLENDLRMLKVQFTILWDLKQAVLDDTNTLKVIKDHDMLHIPATIRQFGCLSKCNSDRF